MYEVLRNKNVLSVEDNLTNQRYAECNLRKLNINFYTASDGIEALTLLKEHKFDLILMDLYLPNMNGVHCIKTIRYDLSINTPIIVLTAGLMELHQEILPLISGYLLKPYTQKELIDLAVKCLK